MRKGNSMQFKTKEAGKVFAQYIRRLERSISKLPSEMQTDIQNEISGHILDSMEHSKGELELDKLLDAIERLGNPEKFMKPMIADYEAVYATSTFQPVHILRAMVRNLGAGFERTVKYSVFFILYSTLFSFAILFLGKIFFPGNTGLFINNNGGFKAFGIFSPVLGDVELLGYWLLPMSLIGLVMDYFLITFIMKLMVKRKK